MAVESKKHHFVPRSLLRNFSDATGRLFVFDKRTSNSFLSSADNAGHENYFNVIEVEGEKLNFEKAFDKVDAEQALLVKKILAFENGWQLSEDELYKLAYFTLVQLLRTKLNRTTIVEFANDLQTWLDELNQNGTFQQVNTRLNDDASKLISLEQIFKIPENIHLLLERKLSVMRAPDDYPFYCSDNPVVFHNPFPYLKTGLAGVGTDVYFPLSKNVIVAFTCAATARKLYHVYHVLVKKGAPLPEGLKAHYESVFEHKIFELQHQYVDLYNYLQVANSSRFLYAPINHFDMALKILEETPELSEVLTKRKLGSNEPANGMADGHFLMFMFEDNDHSLIAGELIAADFDLHFRVAAADRNEVATLFRLQEPIAFVQVFENKIQTRHLGQVEISSFDIESGIAVITHKDKAIMQIFQHLKTERGKRKKDRGS